MRGEHARLSMQTKDEPKRGRSPGYSTEIAETICDRLAEGESLRAICADSAMPARATVFRWLARNEEFRRSYAIARECRRASSAMSWAMSERSSWKRSG